MRTDWNFNPGLMSLCFASKVNVGMSLSINRALRRGADAATTDTDIGKATTRLVLWSFHDSMRQGRDKHRATKSCTNVWLAPRRKVEQRSNKNTLIRIDGKNNICLYVVIAMLAKRRYLRSCGHHRSGSASAVLVMLTLAKHILIGMDTPGMHASVLRGRT